MSKYDRDSADVYAVKRLGDEIGYGHLMALAHELWARYLEEKGLPREGAHCAVGYSMIKDEYQADALNDPIYKVIVERALADTPQTESQRNSEKVKGTPQTESTGSPIGDYRDGVGAWQTEPVGCIKGWSSSCTSCERYFSCDYLSGRHTDCDDRYAVRTDSGEVVAYACPLGCEQTDCPWK